MLKRRFQTLFKARKRLLTSSYRQYNTESRHPHKTAFTTNFAIHEAQPNQDTFRVMNEEGEIILEDYQLLDKEVLINMYKSMIRSNIFDNVFYDIQRQGRISFYMTNFGEEATQVAVAQSLDPADLAFLQYRELGFCVHRGMPLQQMADTNFSNMGDPNHGKAMPVHYGSKDLNIVTISSTLATQMPQAAGAAYAYKRENKGHLVACFFGEGAASEGDAHAAFNFSAALKCPMLWVCRNNAYAISTPIKNQYSGDGLLGRGLSYGMGGIRVDGNDCLAVALAVEQARKYALEHSKPVMVECMTYRGGHHSTSDDATRYRDPEEIIYWSQVDNPLVRTKKLLMKQEMLTEEEDKELREDARKEVMLAFRTAEKKQKPYIEKLFEDVYDELTPQLKYQEAQLMRHLSKYPKDYGMEEYQTSAAHGKVKRFQKIKKAFYKPDTSHQNE